MKLYFKMLLVLFFMVLCYSTLTCLFGEKGLYAQKALEKQLLQLKAHVEILQEKEISLNKKVQNLSYDYDTIKICANELGFLKDGEFMIKLTNYIASENHNFSPGQHLVLGEIKFMPDRVIKTISVSVGILVILIQMIIAYKRRGNDDYKNR